jgi:cell division protease FtsH
LNYLTPKPVGRQISIDQLSSLADEHRIESATFEDEDNVLTGSFAAESILPPQPEPTKKPDANKNNAGQNDGNANGSNGGKNNNKNSGKNETNKPATTEPVPSNAPPGSGEYYLSYPSSDAAFGELSSMVTDAGATVQVDPQTSKAVVRAVSTYLLPLMILAAFFGLLFTAGRGGGSAIGEVMTFGTIGKGRQKKGFAAPVTFDDVAGADEAVVELREVVDYLSNPKKYDDLGAVPPKGVLLFGPPGCGKTLLAKAVAGEAGVPFFSVAGAEFVESLVGIGAARVRDLFNRVRAVAPAIVFIDELDAAGRKRGHGEGGGSDEREQTLNQLLVEMDGFEISSGIVVMGATNRPDILDPALMRPGRFDRHITIDQPDAVGRKLILELHAKGKPMADSVSFEFLAKRTPGFSGADLANVINESTLLSLREDKREIEMPELEEAVERVLHGPKRRGRVLTADEERRTAYHEGGHAIVSAALGRGEDIHRVSVLGRARGLGITSMQREESLVLTRKQLFAKIVIAMSGIASEEMVLEEPSTGGEQDLEAATELCRDIVARYGMSPVLGRPRLVAADVDQFLGGDSGLARLSPQMHEAVDMEVRRLLTAAESEAKRLLEANKATLDALVEKLMDEEILEGPALVEALSRVQLDAGNLNKVFLVSTNGQASAAAQTQSRRT